MNRYIAAIDFFTLSVTLGILAMCFFSGARKLSKQTGGAFFVLAGSLAAYHILLSIEWLGITDRLDSLEDYIGALLPLCWFFVFYVITQSSIVRELAESERRLSYSIEATSDGLWDWDMASGDVYFSPQWYTMLGYFPYELPSNYETWRKLLHPDDLEYAESEVKRHIDSKIPFRIELRMKTKEGKWRWVLTRGKVVEWASDGAPRRVVGTHVDVTQRKEREVQIRKLQQSLSSIIASVPSVLIVVDSEMEVTLWNYRAELETGITADKATGQQLFKVFPRLERDSAFISQAISCGVTQVDGHRLSTKNDREVYEDLTVSPLLTEDLQGTIIQITDVTERVQMEEMIIQSEKMLSLGGLAAGLAHEINSPLSGITASAQNLKRRLLEDLYKNAEIAGECNILLEKIHCYMEKRSIPNMINSIAEASIRTSNLVRNVLSFSRKSAGHKEPVSLPELLETTYELAASDHQISKLGLGAVKVERFYSSQLPLVLVDSSMMQQVYFNVFRNCLEAMAEKEYKDTGPGFMLRAYAENSQAVVEIEDNGPGMVEEVRLKVFNAFFTTKAHGSGTGLGLSISYFIVTELHRGSMEVVSTPGEFTRFIIRIPLPDEAGM